MTKRLAIVLFLSLFLLPPHASGQSKSKASASSEADVSAIRSALENWLKASNSRDAEGMGRVWAADAITSVPGQIDADYNAIRAGEKAAAARPDISRTMSLEIEEIQVSGDLGFARDTWTFTTKWNRTGEVTRMKLRSIEVWRRQADGSWKIIRTLSYPDALVGIKADSPK
jgi:uncharacterized protein (TIGR02246 family)